MSSARRLSTVRATKTSVSLNNLLGGGIKTASEQVAEELASAQNMSVDPDAAAKIEAARERIVEYISHERPRHRPVFERMRVEGNTMTLRVPSREQADDILYNEAEIKRRVAELSGVEGLVTFNVVVDERIRAAKPIKIEDRLRHMVAKNEKLTEFITKLELDAE